MSDLCDSDCRELGMGYCCRVLEGLADAVLLVSPGTRRVLYANRAAFELYGFESLDDPAFACDRLVQGGGECAVLAGSGSQPGPVRCAAARHVKKDGSVFPADVSCSLLSLNGQGPLARCVVRDNSRRRMMEEAILEAEAEERTMACQDMHDSLSQQIVGISMLASALSKGLEAESSHLAGDAARIGQLARETMGQMRRILQGLAPAELAVQGLGPSLEQLARRTEELFGISCSCIVSNTGREEYGLTTATHVYYIAREAVANALRHSRSANVCIRLTGHDEETELRVEVDGRAFPEDERRGLGMGISIMRKRAEAIGGDFAVEPGGKGGTVVTCRFPGF